MKLIVLVSLLNLILSSNICDIKTKLACGLNQTCCKNHASNTKYGFSCFEGKDLTCCGNEGLACPTNTTCDLEKRKCTINKDMNENNFYPKKKIFEGHHKTAEYFVKKYNMIEIPDGGWFSPVFKSEIDVNNNRKASTLVYSLYRENDFTAFHRMKSDEICHYYYGDTLTIYVIDKDTGKLSTYRMGHNFDEGDEMHVAIKAGDWFAITNIDNNFKFNLSGCFVSPGWEFEDSEFAKRNVLSEKYPEYKELIGKYTRE